MTLKKATATKTKHIRRSASDQQIPRQSKCAVCRALTVTGRYDAMPFVCDRERLSGTGELIALCAALKTWHVVEPHVFKRTASGIRIEPEPKLGYVLREHRCGLDQPTGSALAAPPVEYTEPGF